MPMAVVRSVILHRVGKTHQFSMLLVIVQIATHHHQDIFPALAQPAIQHKPGKIFVIPMTVSLIVKTVIQLPLVIILVLVIAATSHTGGVTSILIIPITPQIVKDAIRLGQDMIGQVNVPIVTRPMTGIRSSMPMVLHPIVTVAIRNPAGTGRVNAVNATTLQIGRKLILTTLDSQIAKPATHVLQAIQEVNAHVAIQQKPGILKHRIQPLHLIQQRLRL